MDGSRRQSGQHILPLAGASAHRRGSMGPVPGKTAYPARPLEKLCRAHWHMVHARLRRSGYDLHESEDLTQEFFFRLLANGSINLGEPNEEHLHSRLMAALRNFLINEWKRSTALKRGCGMAVLSLEAMEPRYRQACEPADRITPETACEFRWLESVLAHANAQLRREYAAAGQEARFDALQSCLLRGEGTTSTAAAAQQLGLSPTAVRSAVYRLRQRYRVMVRAEIAETLHDEREVDDEVRHLLNLFCSAVEYPREERGMQLK